MCKVILVGRNNERQIFHLNGTTLESTVVEKDLEVYLSVDLEVSSQCLKVYKKLINCWE